MCPDHNGEKINIVALGGSIVFPHKLTEEGLNIPFLAALRKFILEQTFLGKRFILVVGGGKVCRLYQNAAKKISDPGQNALDWLGIRATRINTQLVLETLKEVAYPFVLDHEPQLVESKLLLNCHHPVLAVGGWNPGWSTDYVAAKCAKIFNQKEVIIDGDTGYVYDKDPNKFADAKLIKDLTWEEYNKLIPGEWTPGMSAPVDPVAARFAQKENIIMKTVQGADLDNFLKVIEGKPFEGTTIHN